VNLEEREIKEALKALRNGAVVAIPTDTVYGLVADPFNKRAVQKIFQLKGRAPERPLVLFVSSIEEAKKFAYFDKRAAKVSEKYWPGPLTLVLKARDEAPSLLVTRKKTIGIRFPDSPYPLALIEKSGIPLASTSANPSGFPPYLSKKEVEDKWGNEVIVIGKTSKGGKPSTVLDLSGKRAKILRKGPISILEIEKTVGEIPYLSPPQRFNVLFVCTGNTCRSPMAKFILENLLKGDLKNRVNVDSAGTIPYEGSPMTEEARFVLEEAGIKPDSHYSKPVREELLEWADWILCMEEFHIREIATLGFGEKAELLGGDEYGEIPDPVGLGITFYRQVRDTIKAAVEKRILPILKKRLKR